MLSKRAIRAVCTDVDGTLLNRDRQLSSKTIETIRKLGPDFPVILASSRMPSAMRHLQAELDIPRHGLIAYNGAYVLNTGNQTPAVLCSVEMPLAIVERIIALGQGTTIHNSLYYEDTWFTPAFDEWTEREERITKVKSQILPTVDVLERWARRGNGAHKVMCMGPEQEINELEASLNGALAGDIHIYRSRPTYLELAPKKISKASGLELLLRQCYNLSMEEVICFGDNYNDIDMLKAAGIGIAVENANTEVKAVAQQVTGKSIDDGVALFIQKYFFS